ncbi:MAG: sulfotransferase [Amphiplicatus sp.]
MANIADAAGATPNLFVIGAMKCATSSICSYLERHPEVFFLPASDPHFFSYDENWARGLDWYRSFFSAAGERKLIGEGSNSYTDVDVYPMAPSRIAETAPNAKLVYSVRHPIERMTSSWSQLRAQSPDEFSHDINDAIRKRPERFVGPSFYWKQVQAYRKFFSDKQIWIGFVEDLEKDPEDYFKRLSAFLEIAYEAPEQREQFWKNKSSDRKLLDARYSALRALPGMDVLRRYIPGSLKSFVKARLSTPAKPKSEILASLALDDDIAASIREDARQLLAYAGKPSDYWRF